MRLDNQENQWDPVLRLRIALEKRLKDEFDRSGLSGAKFGQATGLNGMYVSKLANGELHKVASVEIMYELLGRLGVIITVSIPE